MTWPAECRPSSWYAGGGALSDENGARVQAALRCDYACVASVAFLPLTVGEGA